MQAPAGGRDVVVGIGIEPHYRWKRYLTALSELVDEIGAKLILSLGAVAAGTPHTQPVHVRGSANNSELAQRYNMHPSRFEGPSGIVGVFHDLCRRRGVAGVSLWASVPHYLPRHHQSGRRAGAAASGLRHDRPALRLRSPGTRHPAVPHPAGRALRDNNELREYVAQLEAASPMPETEQQPEGELPSADALIADLEDFFRQGGDNASN